MSSSLSPNEIAQSPAKHQDVVLPPPPPRNLQPPSPIGDLTDNATLECIAHLIFGPKEDAKINEHVRELDTFFRDIGATHVADFYGETGDTILARATIDPTHDLARVLMSNRLSNFIDFLEVVDYSMPPNLTYKGVVQALKSKKASSIPSDLEQEEMQQNMLEQNARNGVSTSQLAPATSMTEIGRFRSLLLSAGITPSEPVILQVKRYFSGHFPHVEKPDEAADLYKAAARIPRSATELVLLNKGIAVADVFPASYPSMAIFLRASRDGHSMILKIFEPRSINHEMGVMEKIREGADQNNLVIVEGVEFEKATIEITSAADGSLSAPYSRASFGLLMKYFQGTLADFRLPLPETVLLRFGNQLKRAIQHMHKNGYCHLDIKPSNIFSLEGNCYLGDYGAARPIGQEIRECTRNYYPTEFPFFAEKKTDYVLLAKTLLELYRTIDSPVKPMSTDEIFEAIQKVETESVRDFLTSLIR